MLQAEIYNVSYHFKRELYRPMLSSLTRKRTRKALAVVFFLACIGTVSWAVFVSYSEETTDWFLNFDSLREDPKVYRVNVYSIDEVAGKALANVQVKVEKVSFVEAPKLRGPIDGKFLLSDINVLTGPMRVQDFGPTFEAIGFMTLTGSLDATPPNVPTPEFTDTTLRTSQEEFSLLGEPKFYPFDEYVVIGSVSATVLASPDHSHFFEVKGDHTEVYLRAPNFVMKGASDSELLALTRRRSSDEEVRIQRRLLTDNSEKRKRIFAVVLQRPFFLRFFATFMLVLTVATIAYNAVAAEVHTFALRALGYFVGLWAVRQILVSGGPKVFTAVDYVVLLLYTALVAILVGKKLWSNSDSRMNPPA